MENPCLQYYGLCKRLEGYALPLVEARVSPFPVTKAVRSLSICGLTIVKYQPQCEHLYARIGSRKPQIYFTKAALSGLDRFERHQHRVYRSSGAGLDVGDQDWKRYPWSHFSWFLT